MRLEAVGKPIIYRWPGGQVRLEPGKPVELPAERAASLLKKAPGRVRTVQPIDWLKEWRHLATITYGIEASDPRLPIVSQFLERCDLAFLSGDITAFLIAAKQVEEAVNLR